MAIRRYLFPHNINYSEKDLGRATLRHRRGSSFSGLSSPQLLPFPIVYTFKRPASLPVFPRIFEALFFDLSVFFMCFKVIIPCKSAAVSLTSSLPPLVLSYRLYVLTTGSLHIIICKAFSALRAFNRLVLTNWQFTYYRLRGFYLRFACVTVGFVCRSLHMAPAAGQLRFAHNTDI